MKRIIIILSAFFISLAMYAQDPIVDFHAGLIIGFTDQQIEGLMRRNGSDIEVYLSGTWKSLGDGTSIDSVVNNGNGTFSIFLNDSSVFTSDDLTGPQGSTGPQGPMGATGATGLQGGIGPQGATGPQGSIGPQGMQGPQGPTGSQGATGATGPMGPQGDVGPQGPAGVDGDSFWNEIGNDIIYGLGNVGIGVTDPLHALHANGTIRSGTTHFTELGHDGTNAFINAFGGDIEFKYLNDVKMILQNDGKLVLGDVATPGNYSLYAEHGILTEEVKVAVKTTADWADNAFTKVPTIDAMKNHILQHSHLLQMPSAKEVVEKGYSVTDMDANLLRQIEWLNMHLITLSETNKALQQKLEQLENQFIEEE